MFKKILVPVDGSETAWRALNNALEIGKKFESEILVVNVIQPYNNAALLAVPLDHATINQGNSELEKVGDKVLELAKEMVGSYPHKVEYDMEVGHPSERIIALSKKVEPTRSFWAAADSAALLNFSWAASVPRFLSMQQCRY